MKLLIYSHFFAPSIGGVETLVLSLARGLAGLGAASGDSEFEITLVTQTHAGKFDDLSLPFRVVRRPSLIQFCQPGAPRCDSDGSSDQNRCGQSQTKKRG